MLPDDAENVSGARCGSRNKIKNLHHGSGGCDG